MVGVAFFVVIQAVIFLKDQTTPFRLIIPVGPATQTNGSKRLPDAAAGSRPSRIGREHSYLFVRYFSDLFRIFFVFRE